MRKGPENRLVAVAGVEVGRFQAVAALVVGASRAPATARGAGPAPCDIAAHPALAAAVIAGGTGLGLSIARSIARDHRGDITCRNRETSGLQVIVTLPRFA